jgi:hypothetical protein
LRCGFAGKDVTAAVPGVIGVGLVLTRSVVKSQKNVIKNEIHIGGLPYLRSTDPSAVAA